jgi:hypothetical protein
LYNDREALNDDDRIRHCAAGRPPYLAWHGGLSRPHLSHRLRLASRPVRAKLPRARHLPRRSDYPVRIGFHDHSGRHLLMGISAPVSPPPQFHAEKRPAVWGGLLSWSFTTLAVAAKHPMSSISDYVVLESAFTFLQFLIVGPLMALAHRTPGIDRRMTS